MSTTPTPEPQKKEHPSTYFVQDRSNMDELMRVRLQDQMFTASMGGVLPEQANPDSFRRILDVGCGTGDWLIQTALTYPSITTLVGVDVSSKMVEYARLIAVEQQVSDRVTFHTMDALRMLEFPDESFDLVNLRFGTSFLRTWDWLRLLQEFARVTCSGGMVRISDANVAVENNSAALNQLIELLLVAFYKAGHLFEPTSDGSVKEFARLLSQSSLQNVQSRTYEIQYKVGTPEGQHFFEDMKGMFRTTLPFIKKWTHIPDNYEEIYQQALHDMQQKGFIAKTKLTTVWGKVTS